MCRETFFKKTSYCTCGMYIRVNNKDPHYVYIDICEQRIMNKQNLKLKYYNRDNKFLDLNCSQAISNENDLDEWNRKIPIQNKHFRCADVSSEFCKTYVVI